MAKAKAKKKQKPAAKKTPAAKTKAKPAAKAKAKPTRKAAAKPAAKKKPAAKAKAKAKPAAKAPAAKAKPAAPAASAPGTIPPLPQLPPGEDEPFDIVADYFVTATAAAGADDALLAEAVANAIRGFYDAMEAGGGDRGEYAGHFFLADGAALGSKPREVPLRRITDKALTDRIMKLWEELERTVE